MRWLASRPPEGSSAPLLLCVGHSVLLPRLWLCPLVLNSLPTPAPGVDLMPAPAWRLGSLTGKARSPLEGWPRPGWSGSLGSGCPSPCPAAAPCSGPTACSLRALALRPGHLVGVGGRLITSAQWKPATTHVDSCWFAAVAGAAWLFRPQPPGLGLRYAPTPSPLDASIALVSRFISL